GVVRGQSAASLLVHNATYCAGRYTEWGRDPHCPVPQFTGHPASTWKWVLPSLLLYCLECCIVAYSCCHPVLITKVVRHPSDVLEVRWLWRGTTTTTCCGGCGGCASEAPGRWVRLRCPEVSLVEWHPFTLTSPPRRRHHHHHNHHHNHHNHHNHHHHHQEEECSVHVRLAGAWTRGLQEAFSCSGGALPRLQVDGPFGSGFEELPAYRVSVCIGAGIGITPFASGWSRSMAGEDAERRMHLYWVCADTRAFEWFADLLVRLEERFAHLGLPHLLTTHVHLTHWDSTQAEHVCLHHEEERDVVTGTRRKLSFGRPDWDREFHSVALSHPGEVVGVFVCGAEAFCKSVGAACNRITATTTTTLRLHRESF
ncbi:NADPH oxidase 3-like, partial [Lampetra fluviatilis]